MKNKYVTFSDIMGGHHTFNRSTIVGFSEKKLVSALEQLKHVEFYPETIMSINGVEVKSYDLSAPYRPAIIALAENKKARGEICGD